MSTASRSMMQPGTTGNPRLDAIWRKATHINPAMRYSSIKGMAFNLEKWSPAKQESKISPHRAPLPISNHPVYIRNQTSGRRGGVGGIVKLFIIGIFATVLVFTYQLLQENKREIKTAIAKARAISSERGVSCYPAAIAAAIAAG